jgi:hypothetical protein
MRAELLAFILADATVAGLAADRGSWVWRKGGSPVPAFTLTRTDINPTYALDGPDGWAATYVQLDTYGATVADCDALESAVVARLHTAREANTGGVIQGVFVEHGSDENEGEQPDRVFRLRVSLRVTHAT